MTKEDEIIRKALLEAGADMTLLERIKNWLNKLSKRHLAVALVLIFAGWFFRWEITPISNGDRTGGAYMLNRWTGALYIVYGDDRLKVEDFKPAK